MAQEDGSFEELFERNRRLLVEEIKELDRQIDEARVRRASLQARLDQVEAAMRLLSASPTSIERPKLTIKQGVIKVLGDAPHGLTALGILERLRTELDMNYERTSLSPQLSRLKADGRIKLDGGVWSLNK